MLFVMNHLNKLRYMMIMILILYQKKLMNHFLIFEYNIYA